MLEANARSQCPNLLTEFANSRIHSSANEGSLGLLKIIVELTQFLASRSLVSRFIIACFA
jgi:hypothetical protein